MASLALFITINKVLKSPFVVLDEIDSNLDRVNFDKMS